MAVGQCSYDKQHLLYHAEGGTHADRQRDTSQVSLLPSSPGTQSVARRLVCHPSQQAWCCIPHRETPEQS